MLHAINPDSGHVIWHCQGRHGKCNKRNVAHVSHEHIVYTAPDVVALPPCDCGAQTFIKVSFSDEELEADNMQEYGMVPQQMTVPHAVTGEPVPVMIPALMPIGPNPAIAKHQAFAALLEKHGKTPPVKSQAQQSEADDATAAP